jgi:uncharacterized protein involved in type VI secretion and phage assembly
MAHVLDLEPDAASAKAEALTRFDQVEGRSASSSGSRHVPNVLEGHSFPEVTDDHGETRRPAIRVLHLRHVGNRPPPARIQPPQSRETVQQA